MYSVPVLLLKQEIRAQCKLKYLDFYMVLGSGGKVSSSSIIHISKPARALIKRFSLIILIIISVAGLFISQDESVASKKMRIAILETTAPFIDVVAKPFSWAFSANESLRSYFFVHDKNESLQQENKKLRNQLISLSQTKTENVKLRGLLNYISKPEYSFISAKVVGDASNPFLRSIIINAGEKDNIKKGQAVVNESGLVGRIIEVGGKNSRVLLFTDINSKIPVISSNSRERSILSGNNSNFPRLKYLAKDTRIAEGEIVVTSGDGELFPPGIQIGVIEKTDDNIYKIQPFVRWHRLEHLSIINYAG